MIEEEAMRAVAMVIELEEEAQVLLVSDRLFVCLALQVGVDLALHERTVCLLQEESDLAPCPKSDRRALRLMFAKAESDLPLRRRRRLLRLHLVPLRKVQRRS